MAKLAPVVILVLCVAAAAAAEISDLAERICRDPENAPDDLVSVSVMRQLIDYFEDLPAKDKLTECREHYLSSFRKMLFVLDIGNENVCSDDKLSLLEDFNEKFLSTTNRDKHNQDQNDFQAPEAVKVFFMHYANTISTVCKRSLAAAIEQNPLVFADRDGKPADLGSVDQLLHNFLATFALEPAKNGYKDLILPWKLVDSFRSSSTGRRFMQDVAINDGVSRTRLPVRVSVRINGAANLWTIQEACAKQLKPDYSKLALPVLRLINLGLYEAQEPLAQQLTADKNLVRLFNIVQICETLLPIEAFQDDSLAEGKIVAISSKRAAALRASKPSLQATVNEPSEQQDAPESQSLQELDVIQSLADPAEARRLTEIIKLNRVEHETVVKRILKMGSNLIKSKVQTKAGELMSLIHPVYKNLETQLEVEGSTEANPGRKKRSVILAGVAIGVIAVALMSQVFQLIAVFVMMACLMLAWPIFKLFGREDLIQRGFDLLPIRRMEISEDDELDYED